MVPRTHRLTRLPKRLWTKTEPVLFGSTGFSVLSFYALVILWSHGGSPAVGRCTTFHIIEQQTRPQQRAAREEEDRNLEDMLFTPLKLGMFHVVRAIAVPSEQKKEKDFGKKKVWQAPPPPPNNIFVSCAYTHHTVIRNATLAASPLPTTPDTGENRLHLTDDESVYRALDPSLFCETKQQRLCARTTSFYWNRQGLGGERRHWWHDIKNLDSNDVQLERSPSSDISCSVAS